MLAGENGGNHVAPHLLLVRGVWKAFQIFVGVRVFVLISDISPACAGRGRCVDSV